MLEKQRQQLILDILAEQQFASVRALSSQLEASEATIRRDITKMAANGQLNKIRGGAEVIGDATGRTKRGRVEGSYFLAHKEIHASNKRRIAERAVELIEDDEAIIINGGTSTYMMGEFLVDWNLSILTNSFVLAHVLPDHGSNHVTVPGG